LDKLAHVALCRTGNRRGIIVLAPFNHLFFQELVDHYDAISMRLSDTITIITNFDRSSVRQMVSTHYGHNICPICFLDDSDPCWHWRSVDPRIWLIGNELRLERTARSIPAGQEAVEAALREARAKVPNALSQITEKSATLRSALAAPAPRPTRVTYRTRTVLEELESIVPPAEEERPSSSRRATSVVTPAPAAVAPTPLGTTRCHTCGQVLPPGFDKKLDARTENEIYESCDHDFDEKTNICKKCNLTKRAGRFSLLEVD